MFADFSSRIQIQKQIISFQSVASWLEPKSASWACLARRRQNPSLTWIGVVKNGDTQAECNLGLGEAKISSFTQKYQIGLNYQILTKIFFFYISVLL